MSLMVADAFGVPFALEEPAQRIVSLIPSITESVFFLGVGHRVVGVTTFCTEPPDGVSGKPRVGGQKNPRVEAIVALGPDLVVANVEENRKEDVEALRAAGLRVWVTYPRTVGQGIQLIRDLGTLTGTAAFAEATARRCEAALEEVQGRIQGRRIRVFCPIWRRPYMTINGDTFVDAMLQTCGGGNIFRGRPERYPRVTLAEMAALGPEVVLLPDEPYPFREDHLEEIRALAEVPAVRAGRLILMDGKVLCWYGPRIAESLRTLAEILWATA